MTAGDVMMSLLEEQTTLIHEQSRVIKKMIYVIEKIAATEIEHELRIKCLEDMNLTKRS